jgi:membrane dipeptidase
MAEAGIALDLSHLTERGASDALEHAPGHVFASHSNAAAVHPTLRNVSDEVLRGLAERDGVCGLNLLPVLLGPDPVGPQAAAHHDHLVAVGGARLPAVGADFVAFLGHGPSEPHHLQPPEAPDAALASVPEPSRETAYADVRAAVAARSGAGAADALMSGNALAFLRRALGT